MIRQWKGLCLFGCLLLVVDVVTKWAVQAYLPHMRDSLPQFPYGGIGLMPDFFGIELSITHATNTGAVWGVLPGYPYALLLLRLLLIAGLLGYMILGKHARSAVWPLTLIIAGAFGNVIDVLNYGHVIDMIHFRFWGWHYPIFNLADSFISIGIIWLLISSFFERGRRRAHDGG
jgi:signal peptidase II